LAEKFRPADQGLVVDVGVTHLESATTAGRSPRAHRHWLLELRRTRTGNTAV